MFCKALTNAISFRIPGNSNTLTFNPCCSYDENIPFHPTIFKKEREKFLQADSFLSGCSKCERKERLQNTSVRTRTNVDIPDNIGNSIYKLEIVLDTTCNAACIQCDEFQSSLWRKELNAQKKIVHIQPEIQIDARIEEIKKSVDLSKVKSFHFWGGEPLLTDTHLKFLKDIEDPSQVSLMYTTNASIFPNEEILSMWSKFKKVVLILSIDGLEEKFQYIRWPLKWSKISNNLKLFLNEVPKNIEYSINYCVLPLNILDITDVVDWMNTEFRKPDADNVKFNFIRSEANLDLAYLPQALRDAAIDFYGEDHEISRVVKNLNYLPPDDLIKYLDKWDNVRGLEWRKVFANIEGYFKC